MTEALPAVRVLHVSDIHCGSPYVAEHVEAALRLASGAPAFNAIVISGDMSQRAREWEFERARDLLRRFEALAPVLVVPGNHDTAWWHAPFGWGNAARLHERYRTYINSDLEPTLRVPGVSIVGMNSSAGMLPQAVTWYPRDWRVKGGLTDAQLAEARRRLHESPPDDLRILVVHHNIVRGRLSNRWGMKRPQRVLDAIAAAAPDVVCAGHDHEERIEIVERAAGRFLSSTANTLSNRMRGHRPSALSIIERTGSNVTIAAWCYNPTTTAFEASATQASMVLQRA